MYRRLLNNIFFFKLCGVSCVLRLNTVKVHRDLCLLTMKQLRNIGVFCLVIGTDRMFKLDTVFKKN
jgi:hypothetical protein